MPPAPPNPLDEQTIMPPAPPRPLDEKTIKPPAPPRPLELLDESPLVLAAVFAVSLAAQCTNRTLAANQRALFIRRNRAAPFRKCDSYM
jgi:hypothetical protein